MYVGEIFSKRSQRYKESKERMLFSINTHINYCVIKQVIFKFLLIPKTFEMWFFTQHYYGPTDLFTIQSCEY